MNNGHLGNNVNIALQNIVALRGKVASLESIVNNSSNNTGNNEDIKKLLTEIKNNLGETGGENISIGSVIGYDGTEDKTTISYKVSAILDTVGATPLTFAEIFSMNEVVKFNRDYIPKVDTAKAENEPYYIVGEDGTCEIGNITIDGDNSKNYIQRICVLKNICKLYQKYKFVNSNFINCDLSYLFADNIYLTDIEYDEDTKFSGSLIFKGYLQNCTSIASLDTPINSLIESIKNEDGLTLILDDFFKGCYQFNEYNKSIQLSFADLSKLTYISLVDMFEPIKNIYITNNVDVSPINMSDMFNGCKNLKIADLSNLFSNLLSIYVSNTSLYNINMSDMFNGCKNLKTINMNNMFRKLIRLTTDIYKQIDCDGMFNNILSSSNDVLIFSYSGYVFSNALGYCNPQTDGGTELFGIEIIKPDIMTDDEKEKKDLNYIYKLSKYVVGFPLAVINNAENTQDNIFNGYDGNAKKLITWKYITTTPKHIEQTTEIIDN